MLSLCVITSVQSHPANRSCMLSSLHTLCFFRWCWNLGLQPDCVVSCIAHPPPFSTVRLFASLGLLALVAVATSAPRALLRVNVYSLPRFSSEHASSPRHADVTTPPLERSSLRCPISEEEGETKGGKSPGLSNALEVPSARSRETHSKERGAPQACLLPCTYVLMGSSHQAHPNTGLLIY